MTENKTTRSDVEGSENRDPLSGEKGAHPVGVGLGAAGAGAAGAAIGSVVGPAGTAAGAVVGAVVGAVAGGLAGKGVAEAIDPDGRGRLLARQLRLAPLCRPGIELRRLSPRPTVTAGSRGPRTPADRSTRSRPTSPATGPRIPLAVG